jgi:hypothetical protein
MNLQYTIALLASLMVAVQLGSLTPLTFISRVSMTLTLMFVAAYLAGYYSGDNPDEW